jgi:hypothetical protein
MILTLEYIAPIPLSHVFYRINIPALEQGNNHTPEQMDAHQK